MRRPFFLLLLIALTTIACHKKDSHHHGVMDKIRSNEQAYQKDSAEIQDLASSGQLEKIEKNGHRFFVQKRSTQLTSYSCTECHNKPVSALQTEGLGKKAHWDIELVHAENKVMNCATCHNYESMNELKSLTGEEISFDQSFALCGQCHSKQEQDWLGGAHGKNLSGWGHARVSKMCTECHNPHSPAFEKRWPSRFNAQMLSERNK